jgi:S-adenosylmethionine:diacylglycerol 3-amino-3-carboxypropyl transferase
MFQKPSHPNLNQQFTIKNTGNIFTSKYSHLLRLKWKKKKLGKRSICYFSFAITRTDLIEIITAAGAAKATMYDRIAEAQKKSRG